MLSLFLVILAYFMGSICSAVIVCKACSLPDPRTAGSKNPGATNVLRLAGKNYAILVLVADMLKGLIPVLIAKFFLTDPMTIGFVALAAVIGHMYPFFFDFKGGKGVATAIGALLGFQFVAGIMVAATWLLVAKFSRYSSLASIISICLAPFYFLLMVGHIDIFPPLFLMALLILIKHKDNISRLIDGTESKIKLKKGSALEEIMGDDVVAVAIVEEKITIKTTPLAKTAAPKKKKAPAAKTTKTTIKKSTQAKTATKKVVKTAKKPTVKKVTKLKVVK